MRPGGMLVQKRLFDQEALPSPSIRLRISHKESKFEVSICSQATFKELKELKAETGLPKAQQRVMYRGQERENGEFLDGSGVKDRSKLLLMENPNSRELQIIEMRWNAKIQSTVQGIADLSLKVDKLSSQVSAIVESISSKKKVLEFRITTLLELFMRQAVKLDGIPAERDVNIQESLQLIRAPHISQSHIRLNLKTHAIIRQHQSYAAGFSQAHASGKWICTGEFKRLDFPFQITPFLLG